MMVSRTTLISLETLSRREIYRILRVWKQSIVPPIITTCLYFLIFGNLIGPRIGTMQGHVYIDFIVPGLVLMGVINGAFQNVSASFFHAKFQRFIEELMVSPTPSAVILLGYIAGGVARGVVTGFLVILVAKVFSDFTVVHPGLTAVVIVSASIMFSLAGMIVAIYSKSFDELSIFPNFILTPMIYLGGVFYSVQLLPDIWLKLSLANPILYIINVGRYGIIGTSDVSVAVSLTLITIFIAILFVVCAIMVERGYKIRD